MHLSTNNNSFGRECRPLWRQTQGLMSGRRRPHIRPALDYTRFWTPGARISSLKCLRIRVAKQTWNSPSRGLSDVVVPPLRAINHQNTHRDFGRIAALPYWRGGGQKRTITIKRGMLAT